MIKRVFLVQPPFVQLNSPYPAIYYLRAFLEKQGCMVKVRDHSIGLFERIFSREGLGRIFADAGRALDMGGISKNRNTAHAIQRFLSEEKLWIDSIDRLVAFLRGRDREWGHFLCLANGCLPGGPRADAFIQEYQGEIPPDSASLLASKMLADLADFITVCLDSGFSLIRYLPSIRKPDRDGEISDFRDFKEVEKGLDGYIMNSFYRPFLEEEWDKLQDITPRSSLLTPHLLGVSIPFPGCLVSALVCAESAQKRFGDGVITLAGGGYVNTELRFTKEPGLSKYFDHLSLDRPYAFLLSLLKNNPLPQSQSKNDEAINDEAAKSIFPDYSGVDFSRYLYPVDNANAMHRLWSDGHWLKAYLAHGCYWHSCSFCDTSLDYIRSFIPVDPGALFLQLRDQAEKTGCRGIHFVDEAAPPASLLKFALLNREAALPLIYWGNIRLEQSFSPDLAAILAGGGLVGVSAGLEVVTEEGLQRMGKGVSLKDLVRSCAAFKEAGVLVHGYLIYGYWDQDEQELINSAEIIRQFFSHGLLDSAFWHQFVLTRHSRLYAEKELNQGLRVRPFPENSFALNDLSFEGEDKFDKYSGPLEKLLSAWMKGLELDAPVETAFPFKVKAAAVAPDLVQELLDEYGRDKIREQKRMPEDGRGLVFMGSRPMVQSDGRSLCWRWRLGDRALKCSGLEEATRIAGLLEKASRGNMEAIGFYRDLEKIQGEKEAIKTYRKLREQGLALRLYIQNDCQELK